MPTPKGRGARPNALLTSVADRARRLAKTYPRATLYGAITLAGLFLIFCGLTGYYYVSFSRMIDARLHGERDRSCRACSRGRSRFAAATTSLRRSSSIASTIWGTRSAHRHRRLENSRSAARRSPWCLVRALRSGSCSPSAFSGPHQPGAAAAHPAPPSAMHEACDGSIRPAGRGMAIAHGALRPAVKRDRAAGGPAVAMVRRAASKIRGTTRIRHRSIRMVGALFTNVFGSQPYLEGASTITQQLARNFFLTEELQIEQQTRQRSLRRKLLEQFMALILTVRATKAEVLELYLNDVYLGNRGSFAIHGVAEAARLYFGKDVNNLSSAKRHDSGIIQLPTRCRRSTRRPAPASAATWCCV